MKRIIWFLALGLPLFEFGTSSVHAQRRYYPGYGGGVGVGVTVGPGGTYGHVIPYRGFGFFPTYYNGFYGNGFSAYGPPVPTYGSIPGVFGGIDQNNYGTPPGIFGPRYGLRHSSYGRGYEGAAQSGIGFGLYRGGQRPPTASHVRPNFDTVAPGNFVDTPDLQPVPVTRPLHIEVHCREDAMILIDRQETKQTGTTRVFATPSLSTAEEVTYEVRATWEVDGKPITKLRAATGKGGDRVVVDFTKSK